MKFFVASHLYMEDNDFNSSADAACESFPLRYKYKKTMLGVKTAYKYLDFSDPLVKFLAVNQILSRHFFECSLY